MAFFLPLVTTASTALSSLTAAITPAITAPIIDLQKRGERDIACRYRCSDVLYNDTCYRQSKSQWSESCSSYYYEERDHWSKSIYHACDCTILSTWMSCHSSLVISESCEECLEYTDWRSFKSSLYGEESCGVPESLMLNTASATGLSTSQTDISFVLQTVQVVTVTRTSDSVMTTGTNTRYRYTGSDYVGFSASPENLQYVHGCKDHRHTQIQDGSTVLWMAVEGCVNNRPECCAWNMYGFYGNPIRAKATSSLPYYDERSTDTTTSTSIPTPLPALAFPTVPTTAKKHILDSCPSYYKRFQRSLCCPRGYRPFTRAIGGNTPCWSRGSNWNTAPALLVTAGQAETATLTPVDGTTLDPSTVPTLFIGNYVFTRSYKTKWRLSGGAIAGIVVGCVVFVAVVAGAALFFYRRRAAAKKHQELQTLDRSEEQQGGELDNWVRSPPPHDADTTPPPYAQNKHLPPYPERISSSSTGENSNRNLTRENSQGRQTATERVAA